MKNVWIVEMTDCGEGPEIKGVYANREDAVNVAKKYVNNERHEFCTDYKHCYWSIESEVYGVTFIEVKEYPVVT